MVVKGKAARKKKDRHRPNRKIVCEKSERYTTSLPYECGFMCSPLLFFVILFTPGVQDIKVGFIAYKLNYALKAIMERNNKEICMIKTREEADVVSTSQVLTLKPQDVLKGNYEILSSQVLKTTPEQRIKK